MRILVTGAAGFIGFHVVKRLLSKSHEVIGLDSINDYYSTQLKYDRLNELGISQPDADTGRLVTSAQYAHYRFIRQNLANQSALIDLFASYPFDLVIHLAAQAGVRYSIDAPDVYVASNVNGFLSVLEACRHYPVQHVIYASSSSVYGKNTQIPFQEDAPTDKPISLYAATKKSNELMAHVYSSLFRIPLTGVRFFTTYGPWGRPDMAFFKFTRQILNGEPIKVYNQGQMKRDFTYISDVVDALEALIPNPPKGTNTETPFFQLYNIGRGQALPLLRFIEIIEESLNTTAKKQLLPIQPGDMPVTLADIDSIQQAVNYQPKVTVKAGIKKFTNWYREYYKN